MSHVYLKVLNWLLKEVQEFSMPKEAMLFVRFDGLTTMIAAKHLTPGMEIVDEGQIMIVQSAAIEPEFGDDLDSLDSYISSILNTGMTDAQISRAICQRVNAMFAEGGK